MISPIDDSLLLLRAEGRRAGAREIEIACWQCWYLTSLLDNGCGCKEARIDLIQAGADLHVNRRDGDVSKPSQPYLDSNQASLRHEPSLPPGSPKLQS